MQRFLCDEMLVRLGRWLRAAGYDTVIAGPGMPDRALLERTLREQRLLITRDHKFTEFRDAGQNVLLLRGNDMDQWANRLGRLRIVEWLHNPFSRCLLCNHLLKPGPGAHGNQLPAYVVAESIPCRHCPACRRAFWAGGHSERMRRRLAQWQKESAAPAAEK